MKEANQERKTGRPREFDRELALEAAMRTFWRYGYEATSLALLREAMGLTSPQIYNAFTDKETLFRLALARYLDRESSFGLNALQEPLSTRDAIATLLKRAAEFYTAPDKPGGCLSVSAALVASPSAPIITEELRASRRASELAIEMRLKRGIEQGDVPSNVNTAVLAKYFTGIMQGMAIQACDGATTEELKAYVQTAMKAWPIDA